MGFNEGGAVLTWEDVIESFSYHGVYLKSWRTLPAKLMPANWGHSHFLFDCTEVTAQSISSGGLPSAFAQPQVRLESKSSCIEVRWTSMNESSRGRVRCRKYQHLTAEPRKNCSRCILQIISSNCVYEEQSLPHVPT